jgi:CHAT domain-containing protein
MCAANLRMQRRILMVEYYWTARRLLAFGIRSDLQEPFVTTIPISTGRLQDKIRAVAGKLEDHIREIVQWEELARCVEPIAQWSAPDDIVCIVPSGALFYVPLHAVPVAEGDPLIVRNAVSWAPSASALRYCLRRRRPPRGAPRATVFGNPEGNLPTAGVESEIVAAILGVRPWKREDVTRERWWEAMQSSDVIHFAGHAEFDQSDPLASGLRLADSELLSARELIQRPSSPLQLVTLSGCVTGYNDVHPGDELLGLTRAFLYAGTSSLLVTLWQVGDVAAADQMTAFYENWIRRGMAKVDALRAAQLEMWRRAPNDVDSWAAFILIGDWI